MTSCQPRRQSNAHLPLPADLIPRPFSKHRQLPPRKGSTSSADDEHNTFQQFAINFETVASGRVFQASPADFNNAEKLSSVIYLKPSGIAFLENYNLVAGEYNRSRSFFPFPGADTAVLRRMDGGSRIVSFR
jgi:hypothetical protein